MNFQELMKKMSDLEQPVIEQDDTTESCGMMNSLPSPMSPPDQQDSVTMNVSMNGSGRGGIKDLLDVLKNIENGSPADIDDGPNMLVKKDTPDMPDELKAMGMALDDDFANEPDEMYQDQAAVVGTGNDLHSKGAEAPPVNGGGNPRSVKTGETFKLPAGDLKIRLEGLYNDIKLREGSGPKEKQSSKYVDRTSAESKAKVQAAKDKMSANKKAEPGKALLAKTKAK